MPSISETLGNASAPYELELNGRVIKLGLITQNVKSALEKWLYLRQVKDANDTRAIIGEDSFDRQLDKINKKKEDGDFSWGGALMIKATGTLAGIAKTISLISTDTKTNAQVPTEELEKALFGEDSGKTLMTVFAGIFTESMPGKKKVNQDPAQATDLSPESQAEASLQ